MPPAFLNFADLNGINGFRLGGIDARDASGLSVALAGDLNGDGFDELVIGAIYTFRLAKHCRRNLSGVRRGDWFHRDNCNRHAGR